MARKILIADDEVHLVKILQLTLERAGYEAIVAYDGAEALKKAQEERPDLVIFDSLLPVLDGWKVCRMLKSDELTKSIPVIILSASDLARAEIDEPISADLFMEKPFNSTVLLDGISSLLG
ncbi:MAG TPA: response regulator [Candidatus Krumholzibacteriaceae bacterium]